LKNLYKDLKNTQQEKDKLANIITNNSQNKLKASKFHALLVIKKALNNTELEKNKAVFADYEKEINNATSPEEVEATREEILLRILEKFPARRKTEKTKSNYSGSELPTRQDDQKLLEKLVQ
jgi:hypothetical protein